MERTSPPAARPSPRLRRGLSLLVFVLAFASFLPALRNDFVDWDDAQNFLLNPHFRGFSAENLEWMFTSFYVGHYMPLTWLSCALDYVLWGLNPTGYHLTNLVLHALGAVVLFHLIAALLRKALPERASALPRGLLWCAAAGALSYSVHPLRVESVVWATERRDVLSGLFLLLCCACWLRAVGGGVTRRKWLLLSLVCYALSLLSKTAGMALPLILLALDAWPLRRLEGALQLPKLVIEKTPFFLLAAAGAVLGWLGQLLSTSALVSLDEFSLLQRLAQTAYAVVFYPLKTILPLGLSPLYPLDRGLDPFSLSFLVCGALVILGTLAATFLRRRVPGLTVAVFSYAVLIAPFAGLTQAGVQIAADRYSYLACLPFAFLVAGALLRGRRVVGRGGLGLGAAVALVLILLAGMSWRQSTFWNSSVSLWQRVVDVDPGCYLGHHRLGVALHQRDRFEEAIQSYERALSRDPRPDHLTARYDLALSHLALGRVETARALLDEVLRSLPSHLGALRVFEDLHRSRPERAIALYERALEDDPGLVQGAIRLVRLLREAGELERALETAREAVVADPGVAEAQNLLGMCLLDAGEPQEALAHFRSATALAPLSPAYRINLGICLRQLDRLGPARDSWRRALELDPGQELARQLLEETR